MTGGRRRYLQGHRRAALHEQPAAGRQLDRQRRQLHQQHGRALLLGVYNKAFYLLATKSGWNTQKAFQVFARANDLYWTASSTFNQGACGVETAATDLGFTKADVTAAFTSVGVSCGWRRWRRHHDGAGQRRGPDWNLGRDWRLCQVHAGGSGGCDGLKFVMSGGTATRMYVKFGSAPTDTCTTAVRMPRAMPNLHDRHGTGRTTTST